MPRRKTDTKAARQHHALLRELARLLCAADLRPAESGVGLIGDMRRLLPE